MQENVFPSSGDWLSGWKWLANHDNVKERWSLFFQCCNIYKKPVVTKITNIEIANIFVIYGASRWLSLFCILRNMFFMPYLLLSK